MTVAVSAFLWAKWLAWSPMLDAETLFLRDTLAPRQAAHNWCSKISGSVRIAREFSMPIQRANRSLWLGALFLVLAFVLGSLPFFAQIPGQQALPWLNLILAQPDSGCCGCSVLH